MGYNIFAVNVSVSYAINQSSIQYVENVNIWSGNWCII